MISFPFRIFIFFAMFFGAGDSLFGGWTPKSPEVLSAVNRASLYLQKEGARESRLGGRALISMAMVKAGARDDHPFVRQTVQDIQKAIASDGTVSITDHIYTAGLMVLFLADLEPDRYRHELDSLGRYLLENQRTDGSWTYLTSGKADNYPSGDMSMTQYAVMALWTLHQHGFEIPGERINRAGRWLVAVQDAEGGYAYQTTVSKDFSQISRNGVRPSMSAAGMASVYVCRDLFGYNRGNLRREEEKVHAAFREKPAEDEEFHGIGNYRFSVPKGSFDAVQRKGNVWLEKNFYPITTNTQYYFYYLYALERYGAFRELAENKVYDSPPWYDKTAAFLMENQQEDGSWKGNLTPQVDTAYAVLFLLRSTRRTFDKKRGPMRFAGEDLLGGRGLPQLTDEVRVRDGRVVSPAEFVHSGQVMERLADLENLDDEALARFAELPAGEVDELLNRDKAKIQRLVGHEQAEKRLVAVMMLGKSGEVSYAPALIYALTDPDPQVMSAAQDALLRLARIPGEEALPTGDDSASVRKREQNVQRWKTWYRRIDPDAVFEENP